MGDYFHNNVLHFVNSEPNAVSEFVGRLPGNMTMEKVRFSCPRCQTIMQTGAEKIGYDVACPHCAHRFRLVESSEAESSPSGTATSNGDASTLPPSKFPAGLDRQISDSSKFRQAEIAPPPLKPNHVANYGQAPVISRGQIPVSRPGFSCPYCQTHAPPIWKSEVSSIGWIVFAILLVTTCVFCWIGLFIRDRYRVCSQCRIRLE